MVNEVGTTQLTLLKQVLGNWFQSHRDVLKEAYLQTKPEGHFFVVVLQGYEYNEQIEDSLTDLTIEVANNPELNKIQLDVQCLPQCGMDDIQSFLSIVELAF